MRHRPTRKFRLLLEAWRPIIQKVDLTRSRVSWFTRASYWWSAAVHTTLNRIQRKSHEQAIADAVPLPPIFILGFWRSGTTFLHELLCSNPRFGFPSTYACLNPSNFLLTEKMSTGGTQVETKRAMDEVRYTWHSPQEDEFALLCLGAPSPYQALLAPSLMNMPEPLLDLRSRSEQDQECWSGTLAYFLKLLTIQQSKPMVLKSPTHGFRLPLLASMYPQALFVVIERNPYEVFASNLKLWRTLLEEYSLEEYADVNIDKFVLDAYLRHEVILREGFGQLGRKATVRYEDLVARPLDETERVYRELQLGDFSEARQHIEKYMSRVAGHRRNRFEISSSQKQSVDRSWGEFIRSKGYAFPGEYMTVI
jgi:omega-hydroxy-beta-dihydromenaquinone-9 sulfotransferase